MFLILNKKIMIYLLDNSKVDLTGLIHPCVKPFPDKEVLMKIFKHALRMYYKENSMEIDLDKTDKQGNTIVHWHVFCDVIEGIETYPKELLDQKNKLKFNIIYI